MRRKSKHDRICSKCKKVIKGATREWGGESASCYLGKWYHLKCREVKI